MLKILLGALLALQVASPTKPTLGYNASSRVFTSTFVAGAEWACVEYASQTETIVQGDKTVPYAFHLCGPLSPATEQIQVSWEGANCYANSPSDYCPNDERWDIKVSLQYPNPPNKDGVTTFTTIESDPVTVIYAK
jgi:hypothetical protein